jgi:hypothetical protein
MYSTKTHKARNSDPVYLVTRNPFTPLFRREWTYVATVHSSSHQAMTQVSDQLHATSFYSPPVSSNTRDTRNTQNAHRFCSRSCVNHNLEMYLSRCVFLFNTRFQERQPAPNTTSCYHDFQSNHFSPCSSPSALPPHCGQPYDDNLVCLSDAILPILLKATYDHVNGVHNLWGLFASA